MQITSYITVTIFPADADHPKGSASAKIWDGEKDIRLHPDVLSQILTGAHPSVKMGHFAPGTRVIIPSKGITLVEIVSRNPWTISVPEGQRGRVIPSAWKEATVTDAALVAAQALAASVTAERTVAPKAVSAPAVAEPTL